MNALTPRRSQPLHGACASIVLLLTLLALSARSDAQGGSYAVQARVVGAGGMPLSGGGWTLDATVAQADALVQNGAAGVRLEGGFWRATKGAIVGDRIFANGFN